MNDKPTPKNSSELIDLLGGTKKAADRFNVVPSAISNWRKLGIPDSMHYRVFREAQAVGISLDDKSFAPPTEGRAA